MGAKQQQIDNCYKRSQLTEKDYNQLKETVDVVHKKILLIAGRSTQSAPPSPATQPKSECNYPRNTFYHLKLIFF